MATLQKMTPDCKTVTGKVPGPKEHLLCVKHGHVVNVKTREIIAATLDAYKKERAAADAAAKKQKTEADKKQKAAADAAAKKEKVAADAAAKKEKAAADAAVKKKAEADKKQKAAADAAAKKKAAADAARQAKEDAAEEEQILTKMAGSNPKKMTPDCKPTQPSWGRQIVAIPARIKLCRTHGHVIDTKTKVVVADSSRDFNEQWTRLNVM